MSAVLARYRQALLASGLASVASVSRGDRHALVSRPDYEAIYLALIADACTADDLAAIGHNVACNGFWVAEELAWLDRRCDRLAHAGTAEATYRAAVLLLIARVDELRRWRDGTALLSSPRLLNVLINQPLPGPVTLSDGTGITNVGRFIGRLLTAVDYSLAYPGGHTEAVVGVYLTQLAALGMQAEVVVVP